MKEFYNILSLCLIAFHCLYINTSTKVTWHNFDDLVLQCYCVWDNMTSINVCKFLLLSFDTPHNAKVTILTNTDPIVCHKV